MTYTFNLAYTPLTTEMCNAAVLGFTALFYVMHKYMRNKSIPETSEGITDEM